jgi:cyclopropane fatty-acyl-phospholipid synthase-like methyltransferase
VADLHQGETVLDLGSGGGIDVLLSAKRVGPGRSTRNISTNTADLARPAFSTCRSPSPTPSATACTAPS